MGNTALIGAGVINTQGARPTFSQCTIANNHASSVGGGFANAYSFTTTHVEDLPAGDPVIVNSIVWGNTDSGGLEGATQFYVQSGEPTVTYSIASYANAGAARGRQSAGRQQRTLPVLTPACADGAAFVECALHVGEVPP